MFRSPLRGSGKKSRSAQGLARHLPRLVLLAGLAGCSLPAFMTFPPQTRGNKVDPELLGQLTPGTSTRADATSLLGSPTAHASFDDNTWIYIGETTKPVIGGTQSVSDQQVVVLTFDQGGVLRNIEKKTEADAEPVSIVSRTTPSPGNDTSVLQQLLGNVGRFSPGGAAGGQGNLIGGTGGANNY